MNYLQKEMPNGEIAIYREIRDKQGDTVHIWTGETRKGKKNANNIEWAFEMVSSVWAYNGKDLDNRYLQEYYAKGVAKETIEKEFEWLAHNTTVQYAGEDSEGVSYNAIVYDPKA